MAIVVIAKLAEVAPPPKPKDPKAKASRQIPLDPSVRCCGGCCSLVPCVLTRPSFPFQSQEEKITADNALMDAGGVRNMTRARAHDYIHSRFELVRDPACRSCCYCSCCCRRRCPCS